MGWLCWEILCIYVLDGVGVYVVMNYGRYGGTFHGEKTEVYTLSIDSAV